MGKADVFEKISILVCANLSEIIRRIYESDGNIKGLLSWQSFKGEGMKKFKHYQMEFSLDRIIIGEKYERRMCEL